MTWRGWSPTAPTSFSGDDPLDSLLGDRQWGKGAGQGVTLSYSFAGARARWAPDYSEAMEPSFGLEPLSPALQQVVRKALASWTAVADIRFVELREQDGMVGDLRFARSEVAYTAQAYLPDRSPAAGDVWIGPAVGDDPDRGEGGYVLSTLIHEIGHALGLKHPHELMEDGSGVVIDPGLDWLGNSVMSYASYPFDWHGYYSSDIFPAGPMGLDIEAIQHLYGANMRTRAGDTVYRWAPGERLLEAIWDAGGNDTIDWSNQTSDAVLSLQPGAWSRLGPAYSWSPEDERGGSLKTTLQIADGVTIENAKGGRGDDFLTGNAAANRLFGNDGDDRLRGQGGDDLLYGGRGDDRLEGGSGRDRLTGGTGDDTLTGGAGADIFYVGARGGFATITDLDLAEGDRLHLGAQIPGYGQDSRPLGDFVRLKITGDGTMVGLDPGGGRDFAWVALLEEQRIGRLGANQLGLPNHAPQAVTDRATVGEDSLVRIRPLANDRDLDGDPLRLLEVEVARGAARLVVGRDSVVVDPRAAWQDLDAGETGRITLSYRIGDGAGGYDQGLILVTVKGSDDPAAAALDLFS